MIHIFLSNSMYVILQIWKNNNDITYQQICKNPKIDDCSQNHNLNPILIFAASKYDSYQPIPFRFNIKKCRYMLESLEQTIAWKHLGHILTSVFNIESNKCCRCFDMISAWLWCPNLDVINPIFLLRQNWSRILVLTHFKTPSHDASLQ